MTSAQPPLQQGQSLVISRRLTGVAFAMGGLAFVVGAAHLAAWLGGSMAHRGVSMITMKTNAALGIGLLGLSLGLLLPSEPGRARVWLSRAFASAALLIGLLTFLQHATGWDFRIDQLLATEPPGALGVVHPNRMGVPGSASIMLCGASLLILSASQRPPAVRSAQVLATVVCLIGLLGTIGYLYGAEPFYGVVHVTAIAWPTATSLLALGIGLLCARPTEGLTGLIVVDDPGGAVLRRLLLPAVVVPLALGWLRLAGERLGHYSTPMGTALIVLAFIVIFSVLIYSNARQISGVAAGERAAQDTLRRQARETYFFKHLVEHSDDPFCIISPAAGFRFVYANRAAERHFGKTLEDLLNTSVAEFNPNFFPSRCEEFWNELKAKRSLVFETEHLHADGHLIPVEVSVNYFALEGQELFAGWFHDITERKRAQEAIDARNRRVELLSGTANRLLMENRPEALIGRIFDELAQHLGVEVYLNYLVSQDGRTLELHAWSGFDEATADTCRCLQIGQAVCGQVAQQCRRMVLTDVQNSTKPEAQLIRSLGLRSYVCHPLVASGRLLGTLSFGSRKRDCFGDEDLDLMRAVCDQAASALERRQLLDALQRRAEDLAAAQRSAEQAKATAEEASHAKDRFLAVLSHELRTPLAPVLAGISMLQKDRRVDSLAKDLLEMVRRNVELEARLIDDLLDLTRIARGKIELDKRPVELNSILARAVEVCRPEIEAKRLRFEMDLSCEEDGQVVEVDIARMQQVFWNLIKNAIKFTPAGGHVSVRCGLEAPGWVAAEVRDSGVGIAPEALGRIFDAFAQADRAITRQFGGLGLGLAISKSLVELHGGRIAAASEGRGEGSTFRVVLPLAGAAVRKQPNGAQSVTMTNSPEPVRKALKLLIVEDHADTAEMMRLILKSEGHEVEVAGDIAAALRIADRGTFDLLISDLGLPDGSGLDLIRELRARGLQVPAIALSGYGQENDLDQSRNAGFAAHLVKPVDPDRLFATIASLAA